MSKNDEMKLDRELLSRRFFLQRCAVGTMIVSGAGMVTGCALKKKIDFTPDMKALDVKPEKKSNNKSYIDVYGFDKCVECGECLSGCLFRDMSEEESIEAIVKLRNGEDCYKYLDDCVFCMKCNHRCPEDAKPGALLLERLQEIRKTDGIPSSLIYVMNGLQKKGYKNNLFTDYAKSFTKKEKAIAAEWSEPKKCDDLLFCGCGTRMFPRQLGESKILADLPKFGGIYDCCGIIGSRSGQFELSRYITNNLIDRLSKSSFKRLVINCGSCQEQFGVMFPEYIGQEFPFEIISLYEWIDEQMEKGKFKVQRKVELDCAISDSCHGPEFGEDYLKTIRKLCNAIGLKPVELEHHGKNNACCGGGGIARECTIRDIFKSSKVKEKDIKKSGKKHVMTYCQGCFLVSGLTAPGESHYLMDKLLWALGDDEMGYYFGPRKVLNGSLLYGILKRSPSLLF
jgi:Fe-S oxidoreductase